MQNILMEKLNIYPIFIRQTMQTNSHDNLIFLRTFEQCINPTDRFTWRQRGKILLLKSLNSLRIILRKKQFFKLSNVSKMIWYMMNSHTKLLEWQKKNCSEKLGYQTQIAALDEKTLNLKLFIWRHSICIHNTSICIRLRQTGREYKISKNVKTIKRLENRKQ